MTTAALPRLVQQWQKITPFSRGHKLAAYQKLNLCLKEVRDTILALDSSRNQNGPSRSNLSEEVALSIIVLGLTLEQTQDYHDGLSPNGGLSPEERQSVLVGDWPISEFARTRLDAAGLCKPEISRLQKFIFATGMLYIGSMQSTGRVIDHSRCSEVRCAAEDVDEKTYRTAHARTCDQAERCKYVGPLLADIASVIEAGSFPVLALTKTESSADVEIRVEAYRKSISYTAITHVWKDGLGNPRENTLPRCQMSRFHQLLTSLNDRNEGLSLTRAALSRFSKKSTVYIWQDTLCIPLDDRLRKKAISNMYDVYKKATKVLLLDQSLLNISSELPDEELCFRITASPWMRRAWTLQEGGLARSLFVQFADKQVHVQTLIENLFQRTKGPESYNITLMESCITLRYIQECGESNENQLITVHGGLRDRSTSKPPDKEICLATMLCEMPRILDAKGETRTQRIYEQLNFIPSSFFWHKQPCLSIAGYRWAPKDIFSTFANGSAAASRLEMKDGRLSVQAPGLIYRARSHYLAKRATHIRDVEDGRWYSLIWHEGELSKELASKSQTGRTVLAILLKERIMNSLRKEGVVISLDWAFGACSWKELSELIQARGVIRGEFVGRAILEQLEQADMNKLQGQKEKHQGLEEMRKAIRTGKQEIEDDVGPQLRRILEEDDDDWWVFEGEMIGPQQRWSVE